MRAVAIKKTETSIKLNLITCIRCYHKMSPFNDIKRQLLRYLCEIRSKHYLSIVRDLVGRLIVNMSPLKVKGGLRDI